jgi:capsular exopolysaccharide synthesis family protein
METPEADRSAREREGDDVPRYSSLVDYLRVIRRHRVMIVVVTLVFGVAAFGYSKTRPTTYEAEAQMSFGDPFQDLGLLTGGNNVPQESPAVRAANAAELVTSPQVEHRAKKLMKGKPPAGCSIDASVLVETNNVAVQATCPTAQEAAVYANVYARAARALGNTDARTRIGRVADALRDQIKEAKKNPVTGITGPQVSNLEQSLSRVETVAQSSAPVQILQPATPPDETASPRPIRDTGIGLVLGLVIGLLAAFGRDALDRRLRSSHEVHEELGLAVLGRVSRTALGHAGLARNGLPPMSEADFEAFRVLRMNLAYLGGGDPVRSVLVTSGLPEEGKSTVSAALASAAVLAGQRTLLVECDLRRPCFARRFGIQPQPGLTDYLTGQADPQEILQTVELAEPARVNGSEAAPQTGQPAGTLVCIVGGTRVSNPAELLIGDRFTDFLEKVSKAYDLVVLDGSPLLAVVDSMEIMPRVDATIVCVRVQQTTREQARAARVALSTLPDRPMGAVLTGMRRGDPDAYDYYGY